MAFQVHGWRRNGRAYAKWADGQITFARPSTVRDDLLAMEGEPVVVPGERRPRRVNLQDETLARAAAISLLGPDAYVI